MHSPTTAAAAVIVVLAVLLVVVVVVAAAVVVVVVFVVMFLVICNQESQTFTQSATSVPTGLCQQNSRRSVDRWQHRYHLEIPQHVSWVCLALKCTASVFLSQI